MKAAIKLIVLVLAVGLCVEGSVLAMNGTVVDSEGDPVVGATACQVVDRVELICVTTDKDGRFEIPEREKHELLIRAPDFVSVTRPATGKNILVELQRAPSLLVRLVDAESGDPIDKGELFVVYPSAERKGPFPANRAGVRVRRVLAPGEVRLLGRAEGFEESEPTEVTLEAGRETEAVIELRRSKKG